MNLDEDQAGRRRRLDRLRRQHVLLLPAPLAVPLRPVLRLRALRPGAQDEARPRRPQPLASWLGTGESLFAGGCCAGCFNNKGDVMVWGCDKSGADAPAPIEFWAGNGPAYPPCLKNKHMANVHLPTPVANPGTGSPAAAEMTR